MSKRTKRTGYGIAAVKAKMIGLADLALNGSVLAIDPSCISGSSLPGYAWYEAGELTESGVMCENVNRYLPLERRLQLLGKYCREEFEEPDILAIEHITFGGKINMESTIRSTGAIIGNFECDHVIPVSPLAWQSAALKYLNLKGNTDYEKYKHYKASIKSDEADAIWLGWFIIDLAGGA